MNVCMYNSYLKIKNSWTKTLSDALNVLVNCKGGESPFVHSSESREGVALTTKGNHGGFS